MTTLKSKGQTGSAIGLLVLVNLLALSFFFSPGTGDVTIWETWMREISARGVVGGFSHTGTDYPPLSFIILGGVVRIAHAIGSTELFALKCSLFFFLFCTVAVFFYFTRNIVLSAALELSLVLNSVGLGYLDIYFSAFLIGAFFLLQRGQFTLAFLFFAISCAIKYQPLLLAPFVCVYVFSPTEEDKMQKARQKRILPFLVTALVLVIPILAAFGAPAMLDSFKRALTYHKILSGYALNLPWIETWALHLLSSDKYGSLLQGGVIEWINVRDPLIVWPNKLLFFLIYGLILFSFLRQPKNFRRLVVYSMLGYFAYFCFNTGVHENHLFPICCLAWILVFVDRDQWLRAINLSVAANLNLFLFFGVFGPRLNPVIGGIDITLFFAVANLCLFAGFLIHTFRTDGLDLWFLKIQPRKTPAD